jgi:hypothetical protein
VSRRASRPDRAAGQQADERLPARRGGDAELTVPFTPEELQRLAVRAAQRGMTAAELVRQAALE